MARAMDSDEEQMVPNEEDPDVKSVQAYYLRSPSPSRRETDLQKEIGLICKKIILYKLYQLIRADILRQLSLINRYSVISDTDTESIFMEPIHLSSAVAAKQIISEELKTKEVKVDSGCPGMLESAEQLLVEDLYNRVKEKIDDSSLFNTPCVMDLQRALVKDRLEAPRDAIDEVWPNVFIAEKSVAVNKGRLKRLGITHVLNAAHGTGVYTGPDFYNGMDIQYLGIEVDDFPDMDISKHFRQAAEFLDEALLTYRGKVMVSSEMGISRSAVLVASYLMIFHHMTILDALMTIRKKRAIYPNDGFLKQLRELNEKLLDERQKEDAEDSDDDETGSQISVVRAGSCSLMSVMEDSRSITGAKVHSITVEEEDTTSLLGSVMSTSSMAKSSLASKQPTLISEEEEEQIYEEWRKKQGLPTRELSSKDGESKSSHLVFQEHEESEENMNQMIQEWQCKNEKYQMETYLFPKEEDSPMEGRPCPVDDMSDTESLRSQEIRILKQQLEASHVNRMRRGRTDSMSTESSWDMWNERMMEIEREAAQRYCSRAGHGNENLDLEREIKKRDIDEESILSDASSFYNFCQKNKDKLTALERWKIKRIQFGFHKKDSEASEQSKAENGNQKNKEAVEEEKNLSDINLTAYQAWKTRHQKKVGTENKDEIVDLVKVNDSASAKRKQRRVELLERSKKDLEESQSLCSWEEESIMSGSIPLSAFGPSVVSVNGTEDSASALSMQTNRSSFSQARSSSGALPSPIVAKGVPNLLVGPDNSISMASIQNWIANVVSETIAQKQNEIMTLSRPPSEAASSVMSGDCCRHLDDKTSVMSAPSCSLLRQQDSQYADTQSILSCNTSMSGRTGGWSSSRKVTQTSKPLYSLFADEIDLKRLNRKEREMQMEMREKMSDYQTEKLISDNKRSTLFKKKKLKEDDEDVKAENDTVNPIGGLRNPVQADIDRSDTASALLGQFACAGAIRLEVESNVNKWLKGLKAEEKSSFQDCTDNSRPKHTRSSTFREVDSEDSSDRYCRSTKEEIDHSSTYQYKDNLQRTSSQFASTQEDKEAYRFAQSKISETSSREESPEPRSFRRTPESPESHETTTHSRIRSHNFEECEEESGSDVAEFGAKRKFTQSFAKSEENGEEEKKMEESKESFASRHSFRHRQSTRKEEGEEMDDDAIIDAWRSRQEETKAKLRRRREE